MVIKYVRNDYFFVLKMCFCVIKNINQFKSSNFNLHFMSLYLYICLKIIFVIVSDVFFQQPNVLTISIDYSFLK